jgi:hypothetical protein
MRKSGGVFASWTLAEEYGFTDADGSRPHFRRHVARSGAFGDLAPAPPLAGPFRWTIESVAAPPRKKMNKITRPRKEKSRS